MKDNRDRGLGTTNGLQHVIYQTIVTIHIPVSQFMLSTYDYFTSINPCYNNKFRMKIHFDWTEDMSVGESTIDAQHKKLLGQLNKVIDAMIFDTKSHEITEALKFFEEYVDEHLLYEEEYMKRRGYADIDNHKKKHDEFRATYADFKNKVASGVTPADVLMAMEVFLGQWWVEHIGHEDKKYYIALGKAP